MRKLVFIFLSFVIMVGVVTNVFGDGNSKDTFTYYQEISTLKGDSYWSIAQRYNSDGMSKKEYADFIMEFNGALNDKLAAGQKIIVPVIKYI